MRSHRFDPLPDYPTDLKDVDIPPSYDTAAALAEIEALSPDEKKQVEDGIAQVFSAANLQPALQASANDAAQACKNIENMFVSLNGALTSIDAKYTPKGEEGFAPKLARIQQSFRGTVWDSRKLATEIGVYAEEFDKIILPYCVDEKYTTDQRLKAIDEFIEDATKFEKASREMSDRMDKLKDDFSTFTGTFGTWAKDRERDDNKRIDELTKEVQELQKQLEQINIALYTFMGALAVTLVLTGVLAALAGPFAPLVILGGCIVAGIELAGVVACIIAKLVVEGKINRANSEIKDLQEEIKTLQATRAQLEETGKKDLEIFSQNIGALQMVWNAARVDAVKVQEWLRKGGRSADVPEYLKLYSDEAVRVYQSMAAYLYGYAYGITNSNIPSPTTV